jgi:hypothetical protein
MSYQLTASIIVPLAGLVVHAVDYAPTPLLLSYAAIPLLMGVYTLSLPNETANVGMADVTAKSGKTTPTRSSK